MPQDNVNSLIGALSVWLIWDLLEFNNIYYRSLYNIHISY